MNMRDTLVAMLLVCVVTPVYALIPITDAPPPLVSAVCDGVTDDAAALQALLNTGRSFSIPEQTVCLLRSGLTMATAGQQLIGDNQLTSVLLLGNAITGLTIQAPSVQLATFTVQCQYVGTTAIRLTSAGRSRIRDITEEHCTSHGLVFDTGMGGNNNLVKIDGGRYLSNGGSGIAVPYSQINNNGIELTGVDTTGNGQNGVLIKGISARIMGGTYQFNAECGIRISEPGDSAYSQASFILSPWLEANGVGGVCGGGHSVRNVAYLGSGFAPVVNMPGSFDTDVRPDHINAGVSGTSSGDEITRLLQQRTTGIEPSLYGLEFVPTGMAPNIPLRMQAKGLSSMHLGGSVALDALKVPGPSVLKSVCVDSATGKVQYCP